MSPLVRTAIGFVAAFALLLVVAVWLTWGPVPSLVVGLVLSIAGLAWARSVDEHEHTRSRTPAQAARFRDPEES